MPVRHSIYRLSTELPLPCNDLSSSETTSAVDLGTKTLVVNKSSTQFSGAISGTGGLIKDTAGVFTLSGSNSYSGATTIEDGNLILATSGSIADSTLVNVKSGGTLTTNGDKTITALQGAGSVALGGNLTLTSANANTVFSGVISETVASKLIKQGAGTLTLSGTNSYTGDTELHAGVLSISKAENLGTGSNISMQGGNLKATDNLILGKTVSLSDNSAFDVEDGKTLTLDKVVSGSKNLVKLGDGTLNLKAVNDYTGETIINKVPSL